MNKEDRIAVQQDTIKVFKNGQYKAGRTTVVLDEKALLHSVKETQKYTSKNISLPKNPAYDTKIYLVAEDCLSVGRTVVASGLCKSVALHNFASWEHACGRYKNGPASQEESLCRRTNIFNCLEKDKESMYPIRNNEVIYSPNVTIIKERESMYCEYLPAPEFINIVTCPAIKLRERADENYQFTQDQANIVLNKLRLIMSVCASKGDDCLILGAFGCGAYHNPPDAMADMFQQVLKEYAGYFKMVVFAVINDRNGKYNVECFAKVFGKEQTLEAFTAIIGTAKPAQKIDTTECKIEHKTEITKPTQVGAGSKLTITPLTSLAGYPPLQKMDTQQNAHTHISSSSTNTKKVVPFSYASVAFGRKTS